MQIYMNWTMKWQMCIRDRDTGYETSQYGEDMVIRRLEYYGAQNMEHQVRRIQYLTDHEMCIRDRSYALDQTQQISIMSQAIQEL